MRGRIFQIKTVALIAASVVTSPVPTGHARIASDGANASVASEDSTVGRASEDASESVAGGSHYRFTRAEKCLMRKTNDARARHGRRRLRWDKQLGYVARRHAFAMARARSVWHDPGLGSEVTRWRALAQNTGRSTRCKRMFRSFMHSSAHRSNILRRWRYIGVGVDRARGRLYVQQVFESRRDPGNIYATP